MAVELGSPADCGVHVGAVLLAAMAERLHRSSIDKLYRGYIDKTKQLNPRLKVN